MLPVLILAILLPLFEGRSTGQIAVAPTLQYSPQARLQPLSRLALRGHDTMGLKRTSTLGNSHALERPEQRDRIPSRSAISVAVKSASQHKSVFPVVRAASSLPLSDVAAGRALWRAGWLSWWAQVILTVVSSTIILFGTLMTGGGLTLMKALGNGILFSVLSLGVSVAGIGWAWLYSRFGRMIFRSRTDAPSGDKVITVLRRGVVLHMLGMLLALLSAEQQVGSLIGQSLSFFSGAALRTSANNVFTTNPLTPLDVFMVQANTNILLSHFAGMAFSTWLLFNGDSMFRKNTN